MTRSDIKSPWWVGVRARAHVLAIATAMALEATGCSLPKAARWSTDVPDPLTSQVERFRVALDARTTAKQADTNNAIKHFAAAFGATVNNYVDPVDGENLADAAISGMEAASKEGTSGAGTTLVDAAISAMVSSLDQGNTYFGPEFYREMQVEGRGNSGGAGLEVTSRDGAVTVVAPIEGSPAARAGLRPGDQLIAIDGVSTRNLSLAQAVRALRGPVGSGITLSIQRPGSAEILTERLTRETIRLRYVQSMSLDQKNGYLRISQFGEHTEADVIRALEALRHDGSLDALVLDLRSNPGGLFTQVIKVADVFLEAGTIVRTRGRVASENQVIEARKQGTDAQFPVVVLVDHGTAAGSEIVAAALQQNGRAVVVGAHTFGRGTIRTVIPISDDAALSLTTTRAFAPNGTDIDSGVEPDVVVDVDPANAYPLPRDFQRDPVMAMAFRALSAAKPRLVSE